jgi:hypothetical protein
MKDQKRPVVIRFKNNKEAIDLYYAIDLKFFLAKLLYTHKSKLV